MWGLLPFSPVSGREAFDVVAQDVSGDAGDDAAFVHVAGDFPEYGFFLGVVVLVGGLGEDVEVAACGFSSEVAADEGELAQGEGYAGAVQLHDDLGLAASEDLAQLVDGGGGVRGAHPCDHLCCGAGVHGRPDRLWFHLVCLTIPNSVGTTVSYMNIRSMSALWLMAILVVSACRSRCPGQICP